MRPVSDGTRAGSAGSRPSDDATRSAGAVEISVVAPVFDEEDCLAEFHRRLVAVLDELDGPAEIIYVDDGSTDRSPALLGELAASDERVRVLTFSRNFGHQVAISAGLDRSRGEAVVVIDSDLQDPPEVIPDLVHEWRGGAAVVHAVRTERKGESRFKRGTASLFYRSIRRMTDLDLQLDAGDFRLMDRRVVDTVSSMRERHRFVRGLVAWSGFNQVGVSYSRDARFAGTTKYPLRRMVRLAANAVTSFSFIPLQVASFLGIVVAAVALLIVPVVIVARLLGWPFLEGQTTVLVVVLLIGGLQLLSLGLLGEYLGRVVEEVKRRPLYVIAGDTASPGRVMTEPERRRGSNADAPGASGRPPTPRPPEG
jgi:dolichol-phosphate mannosyltransferase